MTPAIDRADFWIVILCLGAATYLIRFSFLGLIGNREIPQTVRRLLDLVPAAVLPALIAPMVLYPQTGDVDAPRLIAAALAILVGLTTRNVFGVIGTGMVAFWILNVLM